MIDNNALELQALECMRCGEGEQGMRLQREFLAQAKASGEDLCSCTAKCPYHGKCVDCVLIHRGHGDHLPECFRAMVNTKLFSLSELTEHTVLNNKHT
jgi:hypothetical protein